MNTKYFILPALGLAASVGLSGCYEMDTIPMDQYVTEGEKVAAVEANPEKAQAAIAGITALFSGCMQILGEDANVHSDIGFPGLMLSSDSRGIDLVCESTGYNWFSSQVEMNDCSKTAYYTRFTWGNAYRQIFACNAAFKNLDPETEDPEIQFYLGQAHGFRAYDYFLLAQTYQFTYKGNEDKACVMIITEENEEEATANGCPAPRWLKSTSRLWKTATRLSNISARASCSLRMSSIRSPNASSRSQQPTAFVPA